MAQYRFSSQVVSRSTGRSAVACAAYRSGATLADERTGLIHDFSRRGGVLHSEIMAPDNAPEWMRDRQRLWNAVEVAEKRKDAQLSREVQLSLPHELTPEQRLELVRGFVGSQFVARGMIADVALHSPGREGDDRNHHAHIMLTMRELTGEGFGNKARDWNDKELLQSWREQWAIQQNAILERHGHQSRVDHRSLEAQGVDRAAQVHMGPTAHQMEQRGKESRIGNQNRQIEADNQNRAQLHQAAGVINLEIEKHRRQSADAIKSRLDAIRDAQQLSFIDLGRKHDRQTFALQAEQERLYGASTRTIAAELAAIKARSETTGWRRVLRAVTGAEKRDAQKVAVLERTAANIEQRKAEQLSALRKDHAAERQKLVAAQTARQQIVAAEMAGAAAKREKDILAAQRRARQDDARTQQPAKRERGPYSRIQYPDPAKRRAKIDAAMTGERKPLPVQPEKPIVKREFDQARQIEAKQTAPVPTKPVFVSRPSPAPSPVGEAPRPAPKQVQDVPQRQEPVFKGAPAPRKDWRTTAPPKPPEPKQDSSSPAPRSDWRKAAAPAPAQSTPAPRKDWRAPTTEQAAKIKPLPARDKDRDRDR